MSPFKPIISVVEILFPSAKVTVVPPLQDDGVWFLDIDHGESSIAVEWDPPIGFGVSVVRPESYEEQADEYFHDTTVTLAKVVTLLAREGR